MRSGLETQQSWFPGRRSIARVVGVQDDSVSFVDCFPPLVWTGVNQDWAGAQLIQLQTAFFGKEERWLGGA